MLLEAERSSPPPQAFFNYRPCSGGFGDFFYSSAIAVKDKRAIRYYQFCSGLALQ